MATVRLSLVKVRRGCALIGWIMMLLTPALSSIHGKNKIIITIGQLYAIKTQQGIRGDQSALKVE